MRGAQIASVVAFVSMASVAAQPDIASLGPQVGAQAIDLRLVDQFGRTQTLTSIAGPKGTMLVFFRSADW